MILLLSACDTPITSVWDARPDSASEVETGETGDTQEAPEDFVAAEVLEALRADRDAALLEYSRAGGWPLPVDGGLLFVYGEVGGWKLAGDHEGWVGQAMEEEDDFSWIVVDEAEGGYKFTRGDSWIADPWSRRYEYDEFGEMSLVTASGAHLERLFEVGDADIEARTLRMWVPASSATHVLYMHDGQNLFDPEAIWGGWHVQDVAPDGLLVVGIDNSSARMEEYTPVQDVYDGVTYGGEGALYADYLEETVRPLIDEVYGEPEVVGTLGSSLGGLISLYIALRRPDDYAFAGSMSGTLGWGSFTQHNETIIESYEAAGHQPFAVYLDSGGSGSTCADSDGDGIQDDDLESDDNYCETLQMRDSLDALGWDFDVDLWHWWEPGAEHNEAAWAARLPMPLEHFMAQR